MNFFKKAAALASVVGALTLASAAHATTTYTFNVDHCTGTCGPAGSNFGTVTVDGNSVSVNLTGVTFNSNGNGIDTFNFSLLNDPTLTFTSVTAGWTPVTGGTESAGSNHEDGFGNFNYLMNVGANNTTALNFTVSGAGLTGLNDLEHTLQPNLIAGQNIYFVADVAGVVNGQRNTGAIGATLGGGVPEPATWALMIVGLGMAGAMLRRRHGMALTTAA